MVLLHIGTNFLDPDSSDVEDILDEIDEYESDTGRTVTVFVARIIDMVPNNPIVKQFNDNVEAMVLGRGDYGIELFMVDMEDGAGLNYSIYPGNLSGDMIDNLDPYATGYTKMANVWKAKFDEIYASCGTNSPPNVDPVSDQFDDEGVTIVPLQIKEASDPEGDPLTYDAVNLPDGLIFDPSIRLISGDLTNSAAENSPYHVQVTVSDGKPLGSTTIGFDWTVNYINLKPSLHDPGNQNDAEGESVNLEIDASDPDNDWLPNNDSLTFCSTKLPQGLTIDQNTGEITGTIEYQASIRSPHAVEIKVVDDGSPSLEDSVNFTWNVANRNGPPIVTPVGGQSDFEGTTLEPPLQIEASDPDGDSMQFLATNLPLGLSIDENTGEISGTISHFAVMGMSSKDFFVEITVAEIVESPNIETVDFIWTVDNVSGPPGMVNPGNQFNQVEEIISFKITTTDPDGDVYQFSANSLPPSLVMFNNT